MSNPPDDEQRELKTALEQFEASVETPFVPGELERWAASVKASWEALTPRLNWLIESWHPEQYAEIGEEDQELIRRVEEMQQEDAAIQLAAEQLGGRIPQLQSSVSQVEPDEGKYEPQLESFENDALALIIRIRKQEQAVRTWLMEAFDRDRGTVD